MDAARSAFIAKGFTETTMEDVISKTTMSKGGVYHYYKNTIDILYDLMIQGNMYRMQMMKQVLNDQITDDYIPMMADIILDKMLDDNPFIPIYVMFLIEAKRNPSLKALYNQLEKESVMMFKDSEYPLSEYIKEDTHDPFLLNIINTFILSCDILDSRAVFEEHRGFLKAWIITYLESKYV